MGLGLDNVGQLGTGSTANSAVPVKITGLSQVTASRRAGTPRSRSWPAAPRCGPGAATTTGSSATARLAGHTTPVRVTQIGTVHIAGVAAGFKFAAILGTDGSVWAWGADTLGQLGNAPASTPVTRPVNTIGAGSGITQISAGVDHMVALKSGGTVLAWGDNTYGELGNGTTTSVAGPVQVTGLTGATQVAAGAGPASRSTCRSRCPPCPT